MNRLDIIKAVEKKIPTKGEAVLAVETIFQSIRASLNKGDKVVISNFGTFRVKVRRPRNGRNPKTGEPVSVPSRRGVRFKASKNLLE